MSVKLQDLREMYEHAVLQFEQFCREHGVSRVRYRLIMYNNVRDTYGDPADPRRTLLSIKEAHPLLRPTISSVDYRDGILSVVFKDHLGRTYTEYYIAELF